MREEGYYWVKFNGDWIVCEYRAGLTTTCNWYFGDYLIDVEDIDEINEERILSPDERF